MRLLKIMDAVFGGIAVSVLSAPPVRTNPLSALLSLLIIRPGGIGDAVMVAPAIRSIKKFFPHIHITILAEQRNAGIFQLAPGVDTIFCYDIPVEFIQALRSRHDVVIDTEQWHRLSAVVARFVRASIKVGFDTDVRRRMFTHLVGYSHDDYGRVSFAYFQ